MSAPLIQCVIVLYKQSPRQASSLSSLLAICSQNPDIQSKIKIFVQDNSPDSPLDTSRSHSEPFDYFHDPTNPGLPDAYNRALSNASISQIPWLLTLDQDTVLDQHFLLELLGLLESNTAEKACAYVPELVNNGLVLSPQIVGPLFYYRIPLGFSGFSPRKLVAFNSAACLSVPALIAIGGFPEEYWLDYLDHIVFYRLQEAGGLVYVIDSQLTHHLSMQNIESEVSIERYSNVLAAEWRFVRDSSSPIGAVIHRLRLLKRALVQVFTLNNKSYAARTIRAAIG